MTSEITAKERRVFVKSFPIFNVLAVGHLCLIAAIIGVISTEGVMEIYPYLKKDLHHSAIRFHVWIDILVELPIVLGIIGTGIGMAILLDKLTMLHLIKITCASIAGLLTISCIWRVLRRNRLLNEGAPEDALLRETKRIIITAIILYSFLIPTLIMGVLLAYKRVSG